jgi:aryl-alcohol dehydrogenase-like predicted oxidoreductase
MSQSINRRDFLKTIAVTAASAGAAMAAPAASAPALARRDYRPGVPISIIGFPSLMLRRMDQEASNRCVAQAFERGCNYFDTAPAYGNAEERLGPALEPYRRNVFLSCKTRMRDAVGARAEFERSLQRLRTDHFELYQLHVLTHTDKDVDATFMKGGAMEVIIEAKKAGRIRFTGFSAHTVEAALAAMNRYEFDSVMFPLNFGSYHKGNFGPAIMELARQRNVTPISIKSMCRQEWPKGADRGEWKHLWYQPLSDPAEADLGVRFALSQPIASAIPPADEKMFWMAMDIGHRFRPLDEAEMRQVLALAEQVNPLFREGKIT